MTFTSRDLRDQIATATDTSDGQYDVDAITEEILNKHGAVDIDTLDTDEFWTIVGKHATDTDRITLPTPVESTDRAEARSAGLAADVHTVAEAKARARVLASLGIIRGSYQGIPLAGQENEATEAFDGAEGAFEEQIAAYAEGVQDAQRDRVQEATIDILAGMVARLMAEKSHP